MAQSQFQDRLDICPVEQTHLFPVDKVEARSGIDFTQWDTIRGSNTKTIFAIDTCVNLGFFFSLSV